MVVGIVQMRKGEPMSDSIDRQAAIEAIASRDETSGTVKVFTGRQVNEILASLPSVQPEIIRCKDCKWYGRADKRRFYRGMDCLQKRIDTIIPDKDFCSRAERREE